MYGLLIGRLLVSMQKTAANSLYARALYYSCMFEILLNGKEIILWKELLVFS